MSTLLGCFIKPRVVSGYRLSWPVGLVQSESRLQTVRSVSVPSFLRRRLLIGFFVIADTFPDESNEDDLSRCLCKFFD